MSETTPTGVPIVDCDTCGKRHPERRKHCQECGSPSRFINDDGLCLLCRPSAAPVLCTPCECGDHADCHEQECACTHLCACGQPPLVCECDALHYERTER